MPTSDSLQHLKSFFSKPVCLKATEPLKESVSISIHLESGLVVSLVKKAGRPEILPANPDKPDMTFWVTDQAIKKLNSETTEDVGEIGIQILKLMASPDESLKLKAKVHIGTFDLLRKGYLSVLPLGGATVMKFFASKGLGNIGKIKDALNHLRG